MKKSTLVVVHMQQMFLPAPEDIKGFAPLANAEREVRNALATGSKVVFLMYTGMGALHPSLQKYVIQRPGSCAIVWKDAWHGADVVVAKCIQRGFPTHAFRACGLYTHRCVQETVRALWVVVPNCSVEVVKDACEDLECTNWKRFQLALPRAVLV